MKRERLYWALGISIVLSLITWASWAAASDEDNDGYVMWFGFGSDCKDDRYGANVYPGADEICDGKDNDCDGQIDEGHTVQTWCPDLDGDGYGKNHGTELEPAVFQACAPSWEWGYKNWVPNCSDPNDTDPSAIPVE